MLELARSILISVFRFPVLRIEITNKTLYSIILATNVAPNALELNSRMGPYSLPFTQLRSNLDHASTGMYVYTLEPSKRRLGNHFGSSLSILHRSRDCPSFLQAQKYLHSTKAVIRDIHNNAKLAYTSVPCKTSD